MATPRVLQTVKLYDVDRTTLVRDWPALRGAIERVTGEAELGREEQRVLHLAHAGLVALAADFSFRRAVRLDFGAGDVEWWRVVSRAVTYTPGAPPAFTLRPLWRDLGDQMYRSPVAEQASGGRVYLIRRTAADALAAVLDPGTGCPAYVTAGDVAEAFEDALVSVTGAALTHLDLVRAIAEQAGAEVRFRWDPLDTSHVKVDLVEKVGDQNPGERVVNATNAFRLGRDDDGSGFASRITPVGGSGDETFLAGGARWPLGLSFAYDSGQGRTTFTTGGAPIGHDGEFVGGYVHTLHDDKLWPILETTAPATFVVGPQEGGPGLFPTRWVEFEVLDAAQDPINSFADPDAEGVFGLVERPLLVPDAIPFVNIAGLFGSADLSTWADGLPGGFTKRGTPTVTEETGEEYVAHGSKAARVVCDAAGEGLEIGYTYTLPWDGKDYVSAWVAFRVVSGTVRVGLTGVNDAGSFTHEYTAEDDDITARGVTFTGAQRSGAVNHGVGSVYIEAVGGPAEFVWDGVVVTHAATEAYSLADNMGPNALWPLARTALLRQGGGASLVQGFTADVADLGEMGLAADRLALGDAVTLSHAGLAADTVRVTRVEWEDRPGRRSATKSVRLGKPLPQLSIGGGFGGGGPQVGTLPGGGSGGSGGGGGTPAATLQLYGDPDGMTFDPGSPVVLDRPRSIKAVLPQPLHSSSSPTFASPTFTETALFSGGSRQWIDAPLATAGADPAGLGTQTNTLYVRTPKRFSVFQHGGHSNLENNPGTGGTSLFSVWDAGITYKTFKVWHQDNDGPGSGLDADLLDGYEASAFPRKAENATITGNWTHEGTWTQRAAGGGLTSLTISDGNLLQSASAFTLRTAGLTLRTDGSSIAFNRSGTTLGTWNNAVLDVNTDLGVGGHTDLDTLDVAGAAEFFDTATFSDAVLSARFEGLTRFDVDTHTYGHALPGLHWGSDLGTQSRQWRTLFVGEIRAAVLVASEEIATVNEVFVVGAGNALAQAMTPVQTTITLRYNNYQNGYYVVLKGFDAVTGLPSAEIVKLTSTPVPVVVNGNPAYRFNCQRAVLFSAHAWAEGQGCATTYGTAGRGWIEQYAVQSYVTDATTAGPTTVYWQRTGTGVLDVAPAMASGNLRGHYNFTADTFGMAAGDYTGGWMSVTPESTKGGGGVGDLTNAGGVEFWTEDTLLAYVRAGAFAFGDRLTWDGTTFLFADWTATTEEIWSEKLISDLGSDGLFHIRLRSADSVINTGPGFGGVEDKDAYKLRGLHLQVVSTSIQGDPGAYLVVGDVLTGTNGQPGTNEVNGWLGLQAGNNAGKTFFQLAFANGGGAVNRIANFGFNEKYLELIGTAMKFGQDVSGSKDGLHVDDSTYIYADGEASFGGFAGVYKEPTDSGGTVWLGAGLKWGNFTGSVWRQQGEFEDGAVRFRSTWNTGLVDIAATRLYWESDDGSDDLIMESTTTNAANPGLALRGGRIWAAHLLKLEAPGGGVQGWTGIVEVDADRFQLASGTYLTFNTGMVANTLDVATNRLVRVRLNNGTQLDLLARTA